MGKLPTGRHIETTRSFAQVVARHDVVAVKHAARLVPTEFHSDVLTRATADEVADSSATQVMWDATGTSSGETCSLGERRLIGITTADITAYIAKRQTDTIVTRKAYVDESGQSIPAQTKPVSNGQINRELQVLKRIFSLAIDSGRIASKPKFKMLTEAPPRAGFFERDQYESVLRHLPAEIRPIITFAYVTGWRITDEVLPLQWRQVDMKMGEVRLDKGTTKNREGRVFPFTDELRSMFTQQQTAHRRLKRDGHIIPNVFFRMVADKRGGKKSPRPITSFNKAWKVGHQVQSDATTYHILRLFLVGDEVIDDGLCCFVTGLNPSRAASLPLETRGVQWGRCGGQRRTT